MSCKINQVAFRQLQNDKEKVACYIENQISFVLNLILMVTILINQI